MSADEDVWFFQEREEQKDLVAFKLLPKPEYEVCDIYRCSHARNYDVKFENVVRTDDEVRFDVCLFQRYIDAGPKVFVGTIRVSVECYKNLTYLDGTRVGQDYAEVPRQTQALAIRKDEYMPGISIVAIKIRGRWLEIDRSNVPDPETL